MLTFLSTVSLCSSLYNPPEILSQLTEVTQLQPLPQVSVPLAGGQQVLLVGVADRRLKVAAIRTLLYL